MMAKPDERKAAEIKVAARNRKAHHNFFVEETFECGLVLLGTEVKSIRDGKVQLMDGYARFDDGELWMLNVHISPYDKGTHDNHEPLRKRKLLMHKRELRKLRHKVEQSGLTLIPIAIYFKDRHVKCELGVCRGKKLHDKREAIRERETGREIARDHAQYHRMRHPAPSGD
jgi:SsrA-binding protein